MDHCDGPWWEVIERYLVMKQLFKTTAFAIGFVCVSLSVPALAAKTETYNQLNLFADVFERIRSQYVKDVDDEELIEAAINGMLTSLDPHSTYLNSKRYENIHTYMEWNKSLNDINYVSQLNNLNIENIIEKFW